MDSLRDPERLRAAGVAMHRGRRAGHHRPGEMPLLGGGAALHRAGLSRRPDRPSPRGDERAGQASGEPVVLIGGEDLCFLCPPDLRDRPGGRDAGLALPDGAGARRWPRTACAGRSTGLAFAPGRAHRHLERGPGRAGAARLRRAPDAGDPARGPARAGGGSASGARALLRSPALGDRDRDRFGHGHQHARARAAGLREGTQVRRHHGAAGEAVRRAEGGEAGVAS